MCSECRVFQLTFTTFALRTLLRLVMSSTTNSSNNVVNIESFDVTRTAFGVVQET